MSLHLDYTNNLNRGNATTRPDEMLVEIIISLHYNLAVLYLTHTKIKNDFITKAVLLVVALST